MLFIYLFGNHNLPMYTLCIASLACDAHARMPIPLGLYRQSLLRQKLRESNEDFFFFFLGKERRSLQVCLYQVLILDSQTKTKTKKRPAESD